MKKRCAKYGSFFLFSALLVVLPAAHATDPAAIHMARAIGLETETPPAKPKAAPAQPAKPTTPAKTPPAETKPAVAETKPVTPAKPEPKSTGMATSTKVWIGAGIAAVLAAAAAGGGGGGGGGAVAPPHPVP